MSETEDIHLQHLELRKTDAFGKYIREIIATLVAGFILQTGTIIWSVSEMRSDIDEWLPKYADLLAFFIIHVISRFSCMVFFVNFSCSCHVF